MTEFWQRLETLLARGVVIDRPKGSRHPRFADLVYPLDYGYIAGTTGGDGNEVDVWQGSAGRQLVGIVCTVDITKGDAEVKLLVGCADAEVDTVMRFHNSRHMSAILVRREPSPSTDSDSPH